MTDGQQAINYDPAFVLASGEPAERIRASVLVQNQTLVDATFTVAVVDMGDGDGRSFDFVEPGTARRGAGTWIELSDERLQVPAGEQQRVPFTIAIPDDAGAGGHYAALVFTARPTAPTGQVEVDYDTSVPVFVTVAGDIERDLRVDVRAPERWRWTGGDAEWVVELHNAGDVHENVSGRLRLASLLSGASSARLRPGILLPGERRTQSIRFGLRSAPDVLRAGAVVERDDADAARGSSDRTFLLPWWLLVAILLAAAITWWRLRGGRHDADHGGWPDDDPHGITPAG